MNKPSRSQKRFFSRAKQLLLIVIFGLLLFYVYRHREEFAFILSLHWLYFFPVVVLNAAGLVLTGFRYYLVLSSVAPAISFFTVFKYFILGGFINKFIPHGGGVFRLVMFKKNSNIGYRDGISVLISFGWLNALVSLLAGVFIIGIYNPQASFQKVPVLLFLLGLVLVQLLLLPFFNLWVKKFQRSSSGSAPIDGPEPPTGFRSIMVMGMDIIQRVSGLLKNKIIQLKSTMIILVNVGVSIGVIYLLFLGMGKTIDLTLATVLAVTLRLSSVIELTPGNLGIREFFLGFLASGMGQGMAQGMTISLVLRLITIFNKGILSLFVLLKDKSPGASTAQKETEAEKEGIFLLGPSSPFRGGISHYNTILFNHLSKKHGVMLYTFKKQYFQWMFPGKGDKDHSTEKIEPLEQRLNDNGANKNNQTLTSDESFIKRDLHPLDLRSWIKAGKEARNYRLILLHWWVVFWVPYYLLFLATLRKSRKKHNRVVFLCHNVEEHEPGLWGWFKRIQSRWVLKRGDSFILHSRDQQHQLSRLLKKNIGSVIVSPHPLYQEFNRGRYNVLTAREFLGIPPGKKVILFFGFIRKYKGLEYLLKALPLVKAFDRDILLMIVGEVWHGGRHMPHLLELIEKLALKENILFINRYIANEEVEVYFKSCDFAVLPYLDGSGSGILQVAYGMDRPVVATQISAFVDVVEEGKTGRLVPPGDEKQLAEAIIKMYKNGSLPQMEKEVREYKKKFEWSVMIDHITGLL